MTPDTNPHPKPISPARDLAQSRTLVFVLGTMIALAALHLLTASLPVRFLRSALLVDLLPAIAFTFLVWRLKAATPPASLFGGVICLLLTFQTGINQLSGDDPVPPLSNPILLPFHSALAPLIVLFAFTFLATRAGRTRKTIGGLAEPRTGRRSSQVLANLGTAALVSSSVTASILPHGCLPYPVLPTLSLAALAEAAADTVSSEVGQAFGGMPILLSTLRRVAPGTDGAITSLGTFSGLIAGALVVAAGTYAINLPPRAAAIALTAGAAGLFFDSLLGATLEARGLLGNDLVNLLSTLFAALLALLLFQLTA